MPGAQRFREEANTIRAETGVQSYTYRKFTIEECVDRAAELGLDAIELWPKHLPVDSPPEKFASLRRVLEEKDVRVAGVGVCKVTPERGKTEAALDYAKLFGADYVSVSFDPEDRATVEHLVGEAEKRGLLLGIHNHGPKDHFGRPEAVLDAVKGFPHALGACVDTGHYLRSGAKPEDVVRILGKRVHAVHIKDFVDEETEVEPGTGALDIPSFLAALREHADFRSAFVLEYEADPDDPTPSMKSAVARLKAALEA